MSVTTQQLTARHDSTLRMPLPCCPWSQSNGRPGTCDARNTCRFCDSRRANQKKKARGKWKEEKKNHFAHCEEQGRGMIVVVQIPVASRIHHTVDRVGSSGWHFKKQKQKMLGYFVLACAAEEWWKCCINYILHYPGICIFQLCFTFSILAFVAASFFALWHGYCCSARSSGCVQDCAASWWVRSP